MGQSVFAQLEPRIAARRAGGGDVMGLHIGDTHVAPPEGARFGMVEAAAAAELDAALYRYGPTGGLDVLREAFAERLARTGVGPARVDAHREVIVGCGATHAIYCALRAVLDPGDEVLVAAPYWPLSVGIVRAAGGVPVEVPITSRLYERPAFDAAGALAAAAGPRTRAIYLITPNNPDGKVLVASQLEAIARLAVARDLWVLADEVYADHVFEGAAHASIARLDGMRERTLGAYSLSKSHALAGARVGFVVAPEEVVAVARRVGTHTVFNVPVAAQRVALAALRAPEEWLEATRREHREARDDTLRALAGSGARWFAPEGGSYVFVDFAGVLDGRPLKVLLERAIDRGVLLAPGEGFGEAYATWARLCFTAVPRATLAQGLARLRDAIDDVKR
jgi:aspartate/methionine/tyrosine aminotransferase